MGQGGDRERKDREVGTDGTREEEKDDERWRTTTNRANATGTSQGIDSGPQLQPSQISHPSPGPLARAVHSEDDTETIQYSTGTEEDTDFEVRRLVMRRRQSRRRRRSGSTTTLVTL